MEHKKANLMGWFIVLVLIFFIAVAYMAFTQPFRYIDDNYGRKINFTKSADDTEHGTQVINKIRMYWRVWPIIIIAFLIVWAFFNSLRQDPNYPYM